ncbi:similar to Saccharomyces cerevisiae YGL227W VID30 Protein involved in proteasome-dependent catabolite degradation of fructose-1,6-bisphosphatase (FBPase) [Maudiozyma barnettii]|uniref:Similar to Saccharomyces cerevisiae YGL227W VID30 Protein involved in proteasome-dependent catabolite degradation of fructose-1,6-bisphosphatase (FBPase) n=1 Tax=Maudiozyma barnettii TaxID=61262 RepID=A0A8H2VB11_9SACH|nr:glucose-induced degradation complex subunit VID30 [Kazachstania barnettii]CAB4251970.1 similar to Saccharomyces cerevisiae YGL227W VID30 Protein involved in proteasome-dependent catabolite degradation of fructose-1,6-bisphosphatase (FBPase) [Kazachstania barnettii]CAD1778359.1 similar to Saccharomyces cerevisiae YGL227W VID30 Protein involved in proteasome-dependent catabolite degradation of fructose-1,6-bisphosphatase (FBPase) [Kazachstania barnettii]
MSRYMDKIDKEFIDSLYPGYLLKQPIALELWSQYYEHKRLFHKSANNQLRKTGINGARSNSNGESIGRDGESTNELDSFYINRLSPSTRKEIWQKLMNLGVLGTVPYQSASDEYIVQLYKYFYLGKNSGKSNIADSTTIGITSPFSDKLDISNKTHLDAIAQKDDDNINYNDNVVNDSAQNTRVLPDSDHNVLSSDKGQTDSLLAEVLDEDNDQDCLYYSNLGESKIPCKLKKNNTPMDIYETLNYPLPTYWVHQPGNSVLISNDGISRISPNPHWKSYMKIETSENMSAYGRHRMRDSEITVTGQKYEYATTWANNSVSLPNVGIYYFEVRVLNVSSSQGGANSNIIVGYKLKSLNSEEDDEESADNLNMDNAMIDNSVSSVHFMEMGGRADDHGDNIETHGDVRPFITEPTDFREPNTRGSSDGLSAIRNNTGSIAGFYAYSGYDGKISSPRQISGYNEPYGRDDVIGCGVNFIEGTIFYTKNGVYLGNAFRDVQDSNFVPAIGLRPGNAVRTNFGLYEEFVFDIMGYQNNWKLMAYEHIFSSLSNGANNTTNSTKLSSKYKGDRGKIGISDSSSESNSDDDDDNDGDVSMDEAYDTNENDLNHNSNKKPNLVEDENKKGMTTNIDDKPFLLGEDSRIVRNGKMVKPATDKINEMSIDDNSIPSMLNVLINDYLIHEGMIDVAKGFLSDLRKDTNGMDLEEVNSLGCDNNYEVIKHNEQQIINEEELLRMRYEIRRLINSGEVNKCIIYIKEQLPGLLEENMTLLYDLRLVEFLLEIKNNNKSIKDILKSAHELAKQFVQDSEIELELRQTFEKELFNVSGLLAYDNPLEEAPDDLSMYLSNDFLQDRLFQTLNSNILDFLGKDSGCALNNIVSYTRSMLSTLVTYGDQQYQSSTQHKYYKMLNMDEDLLNL